MDNKILIEDIRERIVRASNWMRMLEVKDKNQAEIRGYVEQQLDFCINQIEDALEKHSEQVAMRLIAEAGD